MRIRRDTSTSIDLRYLSGRSRRDIAAVNKRFLPRRSWWGRIKAAVMGDINRLLDGEIPRNAWRPRR